MASDIKTAKSKSAVNNGTAESSFMNRKKEEYLGFPSLVTCKHSATVCSIKFIM